jgi:hypothetical protein
MPIVLDKENIRGVHPILFDRQEVVMLTETWLHLAADLLIFSDPPKAVFHIPEVVTQH